MPDYSATPLWRKLGVPPGGKYIVTGREDADLLFEGTPEGTDRVAASDDADVVLGFATDRPSLDEILALRERLPQSGGLWVAWPKKTSAIETSIDFTIVQTSGLRAGLIDNKTCRIDADWQAMRFVIPVATRTRR